MDDLHRSYASIWRSHVVDDAVGRNRMKDCRKCQKWKTCPCGENGHRKGTSIGFSIGECKDYKEKQND